MPLAPAGPGSTAGQRLGRYELLGEIASGGMATVYLGRAVAMKGFSRLVAIKKLHPHLEREEEFVSMFLDEARLAARIRHPNVVPTLDVDDQDGLYIVMEYVEGDRLLGLLRHAAKTGERIPVNIVLRIAVETLSGLHAAHELSDDDGKPFNLVHRDVSPQNVLVGIDGITKITDFGIAKAESRLATTRDGQLKGKIAYMAPEQTRGGEIDRRVDVFAMGILVWEMLTSSKLFAGDNDVEVFNRVLNEPMPTVRSVVPAIPEALDAIVMRALERDRSARWPTAAAFGEAIEETAATLGGLASARVVAQYVQRVAGPKLEQEKQRLRSGAQPVLPDRTSSPSRPFGNERSGVRGATPPRSATTQTGIPTGSRRPLIAALVGVAVVCSGAALLLARRHPPSAGPSAPPPAATATAPLPPPPAPSLPPTPVPASTPAPTLAQPNPAPPTPPAPAPTTSHPALAHHGNPPHPVGPTRPRPTRHGGTDDFDPIANNPYRR